jgi:hypothetical protein
MFLSLPSRFPLSISLSIHLLAGHDKPITFGRRTADGSGRVDYGRTCI